MGSQEEQTRREAYQRFKRKRRAGDLQYFIDEKAGEVSDSTDEMNYLSAREAAWRRMYGLPSGESSRELKRPRGW